MRIGVFNGSFDPVHNGHIKMVNYILESDIVDKVLIVPTDDYWDKKICASLDDRVKMLKYFETDNIVIDEKHNSLIYTYELMKTLEKEYRDDTLYLMMGGDNVINLHKWKNYKKLIKYDFVVFKRDDVDDSDIKAYFKELNKDNYVIASLDNIDISSTYIRENINNYKLINKMIDKRVYEYYRKLVNKNENS